MNKDAQFRLKSPFHKVIQSVKKVNKNRTIFTYGEIASTLSKYMIDRENVFFNHQNIKISFVQDDPLGTAFNVPAFYRCQVKALMRSQLIPVQTRKSPRLHN